MKHQENLIPYDKELEVIYEDAYLIIVNKPQMQNCAPSREHPHGSLVEQVLAYYTKKGEKINPHIVTRLDRNTSGLVVFAKFGHVHHLFSKGNLKEYVALAYGHTQSSGVIEAPIARWRIVSLNEKLMIREVCKNSLSKAYAK